MQWLTRLLALALFAPAGFATTGPPQDAAPAPAPAAFDETQLAQFEWRTLGPVNMGGRIVDLAVDPRRHSTFFVAAASGGVWKTENNGSSFTCTFAQEGSGSIGDVAIAPSDSNLVWVGTGEANPRNSVSAGDGVYRSVDGGKTFQQAGLAETRHIGRIAIHPVDPTIVLVAAMGRTWGPNEERGLYRTDDSGATWTKVLAVDAATGCIDVAIDPADPRCVHAATWERQRDEFDGGDPAKETGAGSGLWRSLDGGRSFTRTTQGLPTKLLGRIGLDLFARDPRILYATVETELTGRRAPGEAESQAGPAWLGVRGDAEAAGYVIREPVARSPAEQAGLKAGDVLLRIAAQSVGGTEELRTILDAHKAGDESEVTVRRGDQELTLPVKFGSRPGGGNSFSAGMQGGQNANMQDRQGGLGLETGGVFRSDDRGESWRRVNSLNPRPFYYSQIRIDPTDSDHVIVCGIQLHESRDGGKTFSAQAGRGAHPDHHALWFDPTAPDHLLLGNDGGLYVTWDACKTWEMLDRLPIGQFYNVAVDRRRPYTVFGGLQDNGTWGGPSATRRRAGVPADLVLNVNGGDGFHCAVDPEDPDILYCESQNGVLARLDLKTGARAEIRPGGNHRFNWNTPFLISPHNARTLWVAGDEVWKSVDRGDHWTSRSPTIPRTDRGTATALAESPLVSGVVYVGTDDGALWLTRDGGQQWESLAERLPDLPGPRYVSDLECSRADAGTIYVTLDGHRSDDDAPYVFRSDDFGRTWRRLTAGLPDRPVRCLVESPRAPHVLFLGNEIGCYVSIDAGAQWHRLRGNLPTVPVFDLVVHPRERDLVAGTHGRGIWILDITPLEGLATEVVTSAARMLPARDVTLLGSLPDSVGYAAPRFHGTNPSSGVSLWYWLREEQAEEAEIRINNVAGGIVRKLTGPKEGGLHVVKWDLVADVVEGGGPVPQMRDRRLKPGDYLVTLTAGVEKSTTTLHVEPDPNARRPDPIGEREER